VLGEINRIPGGGPGLLRDTVSELLGYPIDYYLRIDFEGFRQIIDLIGGIEIDVPKEIWDDKFPDENYGYDPLHIPAGRQRMDGELALKYSRTRHIDSDYGRASRQQQVIMAVKDKMMQPGELPALLPRLPGLALALANSVQTDMPVDRAIALARALDQVDLSNPTRIVVDNTMGDELRDATHGFFLYVDMNKLRAASAAVFSDALAESQTGTGRSRSPGGAADNQMEATRVVVLNGSAQEGLATRTAASLTAEGFNVVAVGNAERTDYAETWLILHGDQSPAVRDLLAQRFGITVDHMRSEPAVQDKDLTLIVGADQAQSSRN
jgi:polyisoprenyl-teichoic acid--peptidoglycan teichoic acid transferase